ncbi:MAG: VanW family protein [Propionicimonas sp.]|nr:VanW family protein [Propionicimonas sp.]
MSTTARVALWTGGGIILVLAGGYAVGYAMAGDSLPRNTVIEGVEVGGLSDAAAQQKLRDGLAEKVASPLTITAGDSSITTTPAEAGLEVDYAASIDQAGGGRSYNPLTIVHVLFGGGDLPAVVAVDETRLAAVVADMAEKVNADPADATLGYDKLEPKVTPGTTGVALQQAETADAIRAGFLHQTEIEAAATIAEPAITTAEAEAAARSLAAPAVAAPVKVAVGDHGTMTVEPEIIAATLSFTAANGDLTPSFDTKALGTKVAAKLDKLGLEEPKDARFTIKRGGKPKIVASSDGESVDPAALAQSLVAVLGASGDREATVAVTTRPAAFTTADAKAAGVKKVTGKFTTYFPGSAYRYNNIGKAAKLINGTYLAPGETFSMNATLGERTPQAGWMKGGGIANGRIDPNIYGGGISQATTTTFNAIFFAGLQDIYHKPHSLYFSRYPMGREATLDWRSVDMKFKNDSKYGVLLQAWITGRTGSQGSVTVQVWSTRTYTIKASKPVQSNFRAPGKTIYDDSDKCIPQSAMSGFDVSYNRLFYQGDKLVKKEPFRWSYNSLTPVVCGKKPAD